MVSGAQAIKKVVIFSPITPNVNFVETFLFLEFHTH